MNHESSTMSNTPETEAVAVIEGNWDTKALRMGNFARELERERDDLRKALSLAGKLCHEVHHPKSMQHGSLDPCPVEALIQQALNQ